MHDVEQVRVPKRRSGQQAVLAGLVLSVGISGSVVAEDAVVLDCPLRDQPFSVDLPLIEILLKPEAVAVVEDHLPGFMNKLPPGLASTRTPSFATIISLRRLTGMVGTDPDALAAVEADLAALEVTGADRRARCARYDNDVPDFEFVDADVSILVFDKINGFDHGPSVDAATGAIRALGEQLGWYVAVSDKAGAFNPEVLARFDAVVWNNVSGDVLTLSQRKAFEDYVNGGGGFLGIHASGGDPLYLWDWYVETLVGARFIGHPMNPQFQDARIEIEHGANSIAEGVPASWIMQDEWYSFAASPRENGATVVASIDESTYRPGDSAGKSLQMGDDHPIVWTRCVNEGRAMYTAIGHRSEVYLIPENVRLLRNGLLWVAGKGAGNCPDGR